MPGITLALLGDLAARREFGKVGTQSDIHLHDTSVGDRHLTTMVPAAYPEQPKALGYALLGADAGVMVVSRLDARLGEQILAADAAGLGHGAVVIDGAVAPEQVKPLLEGTALAHWRVFAAADWPAVRDHVANAPDRNADGPVLVPVDHHFDVRGVGAVVLGVVRQGVLRKGDTLHAWPDKVICPVRSIQVHDVDVAQAEAGDRVGVALRNTRADALDRGMVLAPADAPLRVLPAGAEVPLAVVRSRFSRQALGPASVVHLSVGMQFVPLRLVSDAPDPSARGGLRATAEKTFVVAPGEAGILWHMDAGAQRVIGRATLAGPGPAD